MSYKPPRDETRGGAGQRVEGEAKVRVDKQAGRVQVNFRKGGTHTISRQNVECKVWTADKRPVFASVYIDGEGTAKLNSMRPMGGIYQSGKFVGLVQDDEGQPRLITKDGKWGEWSFFLALYEITDGQYAGVEYTYFLPWKFIEIGGNLGFGKPGKSTDTLEGWCDVAGIWRVGPIKAAMPEDVLVELERRAREADVPVTLVVEDGYLTKLIPNEELDGEGEWDAEEPEADEEPPWED